MLLLLEEALLPAELAQFLFAVWVLKEADVISLIYNPYISCATSHLSLLSEHQKEQKLGWTSFPEEKTALCPSFTASLPLYKIPSFPVPP